MYYEFRDNGEFKDTYTRKQRYFEEQKEKAIKYTLSMELMLLKPTLH
ncbi:MAG: hypothetical protein H5T96_06980 [Tissierellales bacterium]|nr:hypothetical protein [Tissierellales bacterium]